MPMKAVISHVSEEQLAWRRRTGIDRWDEMWEDVLHMPPAPNYEHQRMLDALIVFLEPLLRLSGRGTLRSGINVFGPPTGKENYRIPDLTFVASGRESIIAEDGIRGGGPDAVIEVRSPDAETYDKLPFFAQIGVVEVIVIDRDTKHPEVFRLEGVRHSAVLPGPDGFVTSVVLDVRLKRGDGPTLAIEDRRAPHATGNI